jgi:4-hydroxy 2-oxovalerate aldolase
MQSHDRKKDEYNEVSCQIKDWNAVDLLYFADSLGSMSSFDVELICGEFMQLWKGQIGFHAHDNKGLALSNLLSAISSGTTYCDSTILGMGRGAGNASTESLLMEANSIGLHDGDPKLLTDTIKDFSKLKSNYKWGPNQYYHFAANHNIHPTYVQSLLSDNRYNESDFFEILGNISKGKASSYNQRNLLRAIYSSYESDSNGDWEATDWVAGKEVLIIGSGPSLLKHKDAIVDYIKKYKPFVITLNINRNLDHNLVDAVIVSHPQRIVIDISDFSSLNCPIVIPKKNAIIGSKKIFNGLKILDYGICIKEDTFIVEKSRCFLPSPLAISYALCVCTAGSAKTLSLVGFDGYEQGDLRQIAVKQAFLNYKSLPQALPLESLTPTTYPIKQVSIYAPKIIQKDYIVVIPARYESSRFPGKPLVEICGKSLIQRVSERCIDAVGSENVIVATDDRRIFEHCEKLKINAVMTKKTCLTGTDRLAEVAKNIDREFYINVQGDEPLIEPQDIVKFLDIAHNYPNQILNGMCDITDPKDYFSSNVPKVVCDKYDKLLYMSRSPIPSNKKNAFISAKKQVCIYSFPRSSLLDFASQKHKTPVESIEDIEILRFLEMGYNVRMVAVSGSAIAVDTKEDLKRVTEVIDSIEN